MSWFRWLQRFCFGLAIVYLTTAAHTTTTGLIGGALLGFGANGWAQK